MLTRTRTVEIPEELYNHFETQARAKKRTVDDFVTDTLSLYAPPPVEDDLPLKLQLELKAMEALSNEALWAIGQSMMNADKVALYDILLERNQSGSLTAEGHALLASLREEADSLMVRKAHAYVLLQSRGQKIPSIKELRAQQS